MREPRWKRMGLPRHRTEAGEDSPKTKSKDCVLRGHRRLQPTFPAEKHRDAHHNAMLTAWCTDLMGPAFSRAGLLLSLVLPKPLTMNE